MKNYLINICLMAFATFGFTSCENIIFEENISNQQVVLVAPKNEAGFFSTGITFTWERIELVTFYQLQIATPNFAEPLQVVLDTITANSSFTQQLPLGKYEWRVRAMNTSYKTQYTSRLFSVLSNDDFQNNTLSLISPSNGLITNTPDQNLSWQPIIGAIDYQIQIADSNNNVIKDQILTNTNTTFTFPQGNYTWMVRANNGTQQTLYASRTILVDTTVPNTPTLTSPANASTTTNTSIDFQWNRLTIPGSVEKDTVYIYNDSSLLNLKLKEETTSPFTTTLESGTYYWYVKATDQAGNQGTQSTVFSFTIE